MASSLFPQSNNQQMSNNPFALLKQFNEFKKHKEAYNRIVSQIGATKYEPNFIRNIYKNRGNKYNYCRIWCYADLGTCRITPLFCTNYDYEILDVPIFNIEVKQNDWQGYVKK